MKKRLVFASSLLIAATSTACGKGGDTPTTPPSPAPAAVPAPPATPPPAAATAPTTAPANTPPAVPATPPAEPTAAPDDGGEKDPSATAKVEATVIEEDGMGGVELPGQTLHIIGWRDRHGTNAVVIKRESPHGAGAQIVATHMTREGDASWTTVRDFKELVSDCNDHRLTLEAQAGAWSVTDLDNDGLGEATFAWTAGCRTDWSPITHKVLIVESGEKYVLRGKTGGSFEADADFSKVSDTFKAHAESVWGKTATEKPPERSEYEEEAQWGSEFLSWERLGPLPLGTSAERVTAQFGAPTSKDKIFHDESASGQYFQTWKYPALGLELSMMGENPKLTDAGVASMRITAPSELKTRLGAGVGTTEAELNTLYERFKNTEFSRPGWLAIGIEWTWLTFEIKEGKVSSIRSGLGETPPEATE